MAASKPLFLLTGASAGVANSDYLFPTTILIMSLLSLIVFMTARLYEMVQKL